MVRARRCKKRGARCPAKGLDLVSLMTACKLRLVLQAMSIPDGVTLAQFQADYRGQLPTHMSKLTARELNVPEKVRPHLSCLIHCVLAALRRRCISRRVHTQTR
jgi:hypothetical protein